MLVASVREIPRYMGMDYAEGKVVLSAYELMESERLLGLTGVGKAAIMVRARDLLAEVEDQFARSPWCKVCGEHRMELVSGDPIRVTCTGGCSYEGTQALLVC